MLLAIGYLLLAGLYILPVASRQLQVALVKKHHITQFIINTDI
jgi:hypothetical protein